MGYSGNPEAAVQLYEEESVGKAVDEALAGAEAVVQRKTSWILPDPRDGSLDLLAELAA